MPPADLHAALHRYFDFPEFRPGQQAAIEHVLAGEDTLVVMPTGSGKSLIYQLAALLLPGITLVISPLVALMKDQVDSMTRRGIAATFINSSLDSQEQLRRLRAVAAGEYKLVLVAPERLRSRSFQGAIARTPLSLLAVDEAHCLSQWGHDFRPDYLHVAEARLALKVPVTVALTATATPRVQDDIIQMLGLPSAARLITGFNRPNLAFEVQSATDISTKQRLLAAILREALPAEGAKTPATGVPRGGGIIYTGTRKDAEGVAAYINDRLKIPARFYHGQLDAATRSEVQDAFLSGDLPVVVATNAFGLGIDRPDVRFVIHYAVPGSLEAYYQEAGRAGRDGLPARAVLLYAARDIFMHQHFIENDTPTSDELRAVHTFLSKPSAAEGVARDGLTQATKLTPVKLRIALEQLEAAGALRRLPDDGYDQLRVETTPLPGPALAALAKQVAARRDHKRRQLDLMLAYAEARQCRRATMLRHFGDDSPAVSDEAIICCDICAGKLPADTSQDRPAETATERAALIVLDTVQELRWGVGKGKLAQLLKGAPALDGTGYVRAPNYAKLAALRLTDLEELVGELLVGGYLQTTGGSRPVLGLTARGERAVQERLAIAVGAVSVGRGVPTTTTRTTTYASPNASATNRPPAVAPSETRALPGNTVLETGRLLTAGHTPEHIAAARGLTLDTVYTHLAQLIAEGQADVNAVVPASLQGQIRAAIAKVGALDRLAPIKSRLPSNISYGLIRCVVAAEQRQPSTAQGGVSAEQHGVTAAPPPGRSAPAATPVASALAAMPAAARERAAQILTLGESKDPAAVPALIAALEDGDGNVRRLAASALGKLRAVEAVPALLQRLAGEPRPQVRQYMLSALGRMGDERARTTLEDIAANTSELDYNRSAARAALRSLSIPNA